ncbi:tetratricopeptide repeat protein [Cyclobacterium sp. 1_MG-2023]|uniref:tetratricopeptide repeat protein n=1 Tax=Cyclobacterium sp. 1_MG-2023 TaxID=3062681 RepID=UPI0026E3F061|nr:tetratricopeptide repeat protein [Cyclobacterium sp. 1_MG-2023]MDO6436040.1 tetratricopeptide repeat protein [Cyclobacterium sp. 1_MG-2023]
METIETGISYYKEGKFEEALAIFNRLINKEGSQPAYLHYRARVQSRLGAMEEALIDFDLLLEADAYNTTYISDKAVVLHLLDRNKEAMEAFDQALNLDPNNPYRYSSRAYFRDRIGDLKGAITDYEKAIELDPEDAVAHNNKGIVEEKLGYMEKSQQSFSVADKLTGYKSPEKTEEKASPLPKIKEEAPNENLPPISEKKALNFRTYFKTLSSIFTDKKTRGEFKSFIKEKFKGS